MQEKYLNLQQELADLEKQIALCEIANDSYFLSPLYKAHQKELYRLKSALNSHKEQNFSTVQKL